MLIKKLYKLVWTNESSFIIMFKTEDEGCKHCILRVCIYNICNKVSVEYVPKFEGSATFTGIKITRL